MKNLWDLVYFTWDSPNNPWLGGGGTRRDQEMLERFSKECATTKIYVGSFPGARRIIENGVEWIPLGFGKNEVLSRLTYIFLTNILAFWLCFQSKSVLVITLSPYSFFWTASLHPRCVGVLHHIILDHWKSKVGNILGALISKIESFYYSLFKRFVLINPDVEAWVKSHLKNPFIFLSANACSENLLEIKDTSDPLHPQILFFGRMDRFMKGTDFLLEAFAKVSPEFPEATLKMAGRMATAQDRDELFSMAQKLGIEQKVQIIENPTEELKYQLFSECLFFASPSRFEGWGIAALEACAAGKASLLSDASGFRASVGPGNCGILVPVGDVQKLSEEMGRLLRDSDYRESLSQNARPWARQFTWDAIARKEWEWIQSEIQK